MMKNTFYFILKALFILKIFKFLSWDFGHVENSLIRHRRLISKFMMSQPGKKAFRIYLLPNIPRRKGNQTMKFGQLIEYNMKKIFLEKSYTKCCGETSPRSFSKKSQWSISRDQQVLHSLFLLYAKLRATKIYWN